MMRVLVWGNCQAVAVTQVIAQSLPADSFDVVRVPPVYQVTAEQLRAIESQLPGIDVLVAQPVSDTYRIPGLGTAAIAARLPPQARVLTFPVAYDCSAFPYQVRGYDTAGTRVDAPVTDYHDLRALIAAARGRSVDETVHWWPAPSAKGVRAVHSSSQRELRRREAELTIRVSDLLSGPNAMWTLTHPSNHVLTAVAQRVADYLGVAEPIRAPGVECLGALRTPVESAVAQAFGWPSGTVRSSWTVDGSELALSELLEQQLAFYRERPDVVVATVRRYEQRARLLELLP